MNAKLELQVDHDGRLSSETPQGGAPAPLAGATRRAARTNPLDRERLSLAFDALRSGLVDKAREVFGSVQPCAARASGLAFLDRVEAGEALLTEATRPAGDLVVSPEPPGARRLTGVLIAPLTATKTARALVVFGGNADRAFPIPRPLLKSHFHLVVIRDPSRCFGMCQIPRLGLDYDTNLALVQRILQQMGASEIYCIGFSSGGFPALRFGLDLQAQGVLAFSSPTSLDIADDPGSDLSKYPQLALLYRKARHRATSMAVAYTRSPRRPRVLLVYGKEHTRDAFCAGLMAHVPGVRLRPLPGFSGHTSFSESLSRGAFSGFLRDLFDMAPMSAKPQPGTPTTGGDPRPRSR